jgi:pterin-4a-carbinolamine dehydratase
MTHAEGGLTERDVNLAVQINQALRGTSAI